MGSKLRKQHKPVPLLSRHSNNWLCALPKAAGLLLCAVQDASWHRALASPVLIPLRDLPAFVRSSDQRLVAMAWRTGKGFVRLPVQIDELTSRNTREFLHKSTDFLGSEHRLVLDDAGFSACGEECEKKAPSTVRSFCVNETQKIPLYRIELELKKTIAFVASCSEKSAAEPLHQAAEPEVELDLKIRTLESAAIQYVYTKSNHMLLDLFALKQNGERVVLLSGSEMHLYAKPRYFVPLHFTGDDVRSELVRTDLGPLSAAGQLSFFLDVLLFKFRLNLKSEVTMYRDAIHVPVMLNLPVSGSALRAGSGVLYGFKSPFGKDSLKVIDSNLPRLKMAGEKVPFQSVSTLALQDNGLAIVAGVHMPEKFASMDFTPQLASPADLAARGFPKTGVDFGIFYDITRLTKGTNRFDVWFYAGQSAELDILKEYARHGVRYSVTSVPSL